MISFRRLGLRPFLSAICAAACFATVPSLTSANEGLAELCRMNCATDAHSSKVGECQIAQLLFCSMVADEPARNSRQDKMCKEVDWDCDYACKSGSSRLDAAVVCREQCTVTVPC